MKTLFIPELEYRKLFGEHGLAYARMLDSSKSHYRQAHPSNDVMFNAYVATLLSGVVWVGDVDMTVDVEKLQSLADELHEDLYVLQEQDGWKDPVDLNLAAYIIMQTKQY